MRSRLLACAGVAAAEGDTTTPTEAELHQPEFARAFVLCMRTELSSPADGDDPEHRAAVSSCTDRARRRVHALPLSR